MMRALKLAISGKGGVGKTTIAAVLALLMARKGQTVLAVDADPDANLASALGIGRREQEGIIPISQQVALIEERTGAKVKQYGQIFKLNPEVADITDKYAVKHHGVALLVLGAVADGGSGCACPENVLIRALVQDLVLYKNESLIMDMEAGIEHLGRATVRGVNTMIAVIEPGQRSIDCAQRIERMASQIGLKDVRFVANKITGPEDEQFVRQAIPENKLLGIIPYNNEIRAADRDSVSILDGIDAESLMQFERILAALEVRVTNG